MDKNKNNNGQNASNASNQGKADDGYVEKEFIVLDQNKTRYVTARGILWSNHVPKTTDNLTDARNVMKKIAQKYVDSKYPVMSNDDYHRATYQGRIDAIKNNDDDVDKYINRHMYEQKTQKKWINTDPIMDLHNVDAETNSKIQIKLKKKLHRMPNDKEALDAVINFLSNKATKAKNLAPKVFFPKTRERGIREDIFIHEMELHDEDLFHKTTKSIKNGKLITKKVDEKYDYKDDNGIDPKYDIKKDTGMKLFKEMLIQNKIRPSEAKDLLKFFYITYNNQNERIATLEKQLSILEKSVIIRKNVPYDRTFFDDDHPYNPFLSGKYLKQANKKVESEQKDHPYVLENEEDYQAFQDWLKKDPSNKPILKQIKKGKASKNTANKTSNNQSDDKN